MNTGLAELPERFVNLPNLQEPTVDQLAAKERAKRYTREVLMPLEEEHGEIPYPPAEVGTWLQEQAREYRLWAPVTPMEYGGLGLGELGGILIREQVAQSVMCDIRHKRGVGGDPWPALYEANDDQRARYLDPHIAGRKTMFFGLTEPQAGSDAARIATEATPTQGGWLLNGRKMFIGNGGTADFGVVFAVTDAAQGAKGGVTAFLVDRESRGFRHVRDIQTMGACRPAELEFTNCFVPDENVLGEVGFGFKLAQRTLSRTRLRQISLNLGAAQRALEGTVGWMRSRSTFGRKLAHRQALRWKIATAAAELRAARLMCYRLAASIDQGQQVRREVPAAKMFAAQTAGRVIDLAIQLHGGRGVTKDYPFERLYRDVRGLRITEGADELQVALVARELFE